MHARGWKVAGAVHTSEYGETPLSWIFRLEDRAHRAFPRGCTLEQSESLVTMHTHLDALAALETSDPAAAARAARVPADQWSHLRALVELDAAAADLRDAVKIESLHIWPVYRALRRRLQDARFVTHDDLLTVSGKLGAGILATNDPITLVAAWTSNALPRAPLAHFVAALTPFLASWRAGRMTSEDGALLRTYGALCTLQHEIWGGDEADFKLGAWMLEPMRLWMEGASIGRITQETDVSAGHACKEIQRTGELLRQMTEAAEYAGDTTLAQLCGRARQALTRGLPFVQSLHLRK